MHSFKDEKKIKNIELCCEHCLAEEMITALQFAREYESIDLIADANTVTEVLRTLLNVEVDGEMFTLGMVNIDGEACDYDKEFILSINDDFSIWIEPAWRKIDGEMRLFDTEAHITYLHGDCNFRILQKLEKDKNSVVIFDFEEDDE